MSSTEEDIAVIAASGLFDPEHYLKSYPDVAAAGVDPLWHYVVFGAAEGRDPSADFSGVAYASAQADWEAGTNPLAHHVRSGARYRVQDAVLAKEDIHGRIRQTGMFDDDWYRSAYPDVAAAGVDPLVHFLDFGFAEGRQPGLAFPLAPYMLRYREALADGVNPLVDYALNTASRNLTFSTEERRRALPLVLADKARNPAFSPQVRFNAAYDLVTNAQDRYPELVGIFGELAQVPELEKPALRMQSLCRQLLRRARKAPMEAYRDPTAQGLPAPSENTMIAGESVMVLRRERARRVIFVFTGGDNRVWVPVQVFQSYLPEDVHLVFLCDPTGAGHRFGLSALGYGYGNTLAGLRRLVEDLGAEEVFCIGSSSGGFAAMRYGLDLGARGLLAFVPTIFLTEQAPDLPTLEGYLGVSLAQAAPPGSTDLRAVFEAAGDWPQTVICYGGANPVDSAQARHMTGLAKVRLVEVTGYEGHDVVAELIASGQIESLIAELLAA